MENNSKTFSIPKKVWDSVSLLKPKEKNIVLSILFEYGCTGFFNIDEVKNGALKALLMMIKNDMDNIAEFKEAQQQQRDRRAEIARENGKKHAAKTEKEPNDNQQEPTNNPKEPINNPQEPTTNPAEPTILYNINTNKYKGENNTVGFSAPTLDEVKKFVSVKGIKINPEKFFYHYQSKNWEGITDWQARCMVWQAEDSGKSAANDKEYSYNDYCAMIQKGYKAEDFTKEKKSDGKLVWKLKAA